MKYHNSPNGPRPCKADVRECIYGSSGAPHFDTQAEAQSAYEEKMAESFGAFDKVKRSKSEKVRQSSYRGIDKTFETIRKVKASQAVAKTVETMTAVKESPQRAKVLGNKWINKAKAKYRASKREFNSILANAKVEQVLKNENYFENYEAAELDRRRKKTEAELNAELSPRTKSMKERAIEAGYNVSVQVKSMKNDLGKIEVASTKNASNVKIGDKLPDGSKVGMIMNDGDRVTITTIDDDYKITSTTYSDSDTIKTTRTVSDKVSSIKKSPFYSRMRTAAKQQREVFYTLTGYSNKKATQERSEANSAVQQTIHANNSKRSEYTKGA